MTTKLKRAVEHGRLSLWRHVIWFAAALFLFASEGFAQNYELTMQPRRMGDQIAVELWIKSLNASTAAVGNASIYVNYNTTYLQPAAIVAVGGTADLINPAPTTDTVSHDVDMTQPLITVTSPFVNGVVGYTSLTAQSVTATQGGTTVNAFGLEINYNNVTNLAGAIPATTGKGSFLGMLKFDIIGDKNVLSATDMIDIVFNTETFAGDVVIEDKSGNDIESQITLTNPSNISIQGITILNPSILNQAVNRYPTQPYSVFTVGANRGYPVYFERSGLIDPTGAAAASAQYGEKDLAYAVDYSLDGGTNWTETGRISEDRDDNGTMGGNVAHFINGDIDFLNPTNYYMTRGNGDRLSGGLGGAPAGTDGDASVLRFIWKGDQFFPYRSENAKLRLVQLDTLGTAANLSLRARYTAATRQDETNETFVLGRMFFAQLDGTTGYFKTKEKYSNATQLTVMAWVNLNGIQATAGAEPGIVVCSEGSKSLEEGAWMLYLHEGVRPAFRAREKEARGPSGYIANVIAPAYDSLTTIVSDNPITDAHGGNWMHVAATVVDGTIKLYVNGEIVAQETNTTAVNPRLLDAKQTVWMGVNPTGGIAATDYLKAGMKEVSVWRVGLSQDQLRSYIAGVNDPDGTTTPLDGIASDYRTALELYYPLQGARADQADDATYQYNANELNYYTDASITATAVNSSINYRPDRSHIRLTSPVGGEGVSNLKDKTFEVRWAAYGIGSTVANSNDIQIQLSRDGGTTWFDAIDNQVPAFALDDVEVEAGEAMWEPYNSITASGQVDDLQGVVDIENNWQKTVKLRISGIATNGQDNIISTSGDFYVAPYFALQNSGNSKIEIEGASDLNMNSGSYYVEAWIRPFRFPTVAEVFFPIAAKKTADAATMHYSLRLLPTGQLQFVMGSTTGDATRTATSDLALALKAPSVVDKDTLWSHVGVYVNVNSGGQSVVNFFIDGTIQNSGTISDQLGTNITVENLNIYPAYIASEPTSATETANFIGELKEIRFWNGIPGNLSHTGAAPTDFTKFVQGSATIRANELGNFAGTDYTANLVAAFELNGGPFVNSGRIRTIQAFPTSADILARITDSDGKGDGNTMFGSTRPLVKLVEPIYKQAVPNAKTDLKVRWTGFDYNRNNIVTFKNGDAVDHADLDFGTQGGGSTSVVHYQEVASKKYDAAYTNSMTLTSINSAYEFQGTSTKSQFAANLNVALSDPDVNDDKVYADQGPVAATETRGRLRLVGRSMINGYMVETDNLTDGKMPSLYTETEYFNITPPSNFTVRVLLEGYHTDAQVANGVQNDIGTTYENKGLKISLYTDNANKPSVLTATALSSEGYANTATAFKTTNRNGGDNSFANVPFVFTEIKEQKYFVVVEHINHLPIMSRYAANYEYSGDDATSWTIESGWDFQNWGGGVASTDLITSTEANASPLVIGNKYTAWGNNETDSDKKEYANTGMNYNDGRVTGTANPIASMVGGDCQKDYKIDGLDRTRVRLDNGGSVARSDVTGDGLINADDRTIVDRNNGKVSSLTDVTGLTLSSNTMSIDDSPAGLIASAGDMIERFETTSAAYVKNGGEKIHKNFFIGDAKLAGLDYTVTAEAKMVNDEIELSMYINNNGGAWAMGNATYGVKYNPAVLQYVELVKNDAVIFADNSSLGYSALYSSPTSQTKEPIAGIRTIEVDYDAYTEKGGQTVPNAKTYLGTLKFKVVQATSVYDFSWHRITSIHDRGGKIVTGDGEFKVIKPIIVQRDASIKLPDGGEEWQAASIYTISWTKTENDSQVLIDYSVDNGNSWNRITPEAIDIKAASYHWKTPQVSSDECLVRIIDADTKVEIDRSNAAFTIIAAPAEIIRPASTDPIYFSGTKDFIRWSVNDPKQVRFEFSANGSSNWKAVATEINSASNQVEWTVPVANTRSAVVRMINKESNDVMAVSRPFRILGDRLTITSPNAKSDVRQSSKTIISWSDYANIDLVDLYLSIDGGKNWTMIKQDVNATKGQENWIPAVVADKAIIRALYNEDPSLEFSRSEEFKIGPKSSVDDMANLGYIFERLSPNPFTEESKINFTLPTEKVVTLKVYSSTGNLVQTILDNVSLSADKHTYKLDGNNLPAGMYIVRLTAGSYELVRQVVHVK